MPCADRRPGSLRSRLLVAAVASAVLTTVLTLVVHTFVWKSDVLTRAFLREESNDIAHLLVYDAAGRPVGVSPTAEDGWPYRMVPTEMKFAVVDDDGRVVVASEPRSAPMVPRDGRFEPKVANFIAVEGGMPIDVLTTRKRLGDASYWVQVGRSERLSGYLDARMAERLLKVGLITVLVALLLFALMVLVTVNRLLRPLREVSAAAEAVTPARLDARLATRELPRELVPLVDGFNQALQRVERGFRMQQEFLANAAHELKTPLALVRGQVELSQIPERDQLLADLDGMARQVHQLLHLAEVSETGNFSFARLDAGEVVEEVLEPLGRLARERGINLARRLPGTPTEVHGDRGALYVLVKNLVENAIHHSAPGDIVTLDLNAERLQVRDEGCGVPEADVPKLFDRFWRGAASTGAGLGLAICREIAQAHGWRLGARNGSPGMVFELRFAD